jgi:hypothetical protein
MASFSQQLTNGDTSQIDMTHIGLFPEIECYNDCNGGWNHYIKDSLAKFLTDHKGYPDHPYYSAKF